jgi:hypothetical protein
MLTTPPQSPCFCASLSLAVRSNREGTLCGAPIHFILKFPTDYPQKQPEVRLLQALPHPNVTRAEGVQVLGVTAPPPGSSGSLAQHRSRPLPREARYRLALWDCIPGHNSWSSAYSVLSVLLQLQGGRMCWWGGVGWDGRGGCGVQWVLLHAPMRSQWCCGFTDCLAAVTPPACFCSLLSYSRHAAPGQQSLVAQLLWGCAQLAPLIA